MLIRPDRRRRRSDLENTYLESRAVSERWPLTPDVRAKILQRLIDVVDPEYLHAIGPPSHSEVTRAAKALVDADRLNLDYLKFDVATAGAPPPQDDFVLDLDLTAESEP